MIDVDGVKLYNSDEIQDCLMSACVISKIKDNKGVTYINFPFAFDIETTSTHIQSTVPKKVGIMYIWTLGIGMEHVVQGRTWEEFTKTIGFMSDWYGLGKEKRLIIYVHNLPFEFQFFHKYFVWENVFAMKKRQPIRALTDCGVEFRCSYKLSGYSLAKTAENLTSHTIRKLVGDLDYDLPRNSKTQLTKEELAYTINDVLIINAYIEEYIERVRGINRIPMTKTGDVRNFMREECFYDGKGRKEGKNTYSAYRNIISNLTLTSKDYMMLKNAFAGGFTHASAYHVRDIIHNVRSKDFTSSYPYVMVSEKFPMTRFREVNDITEDVFNSLIEKHCCVFTIKIWKLRPLILYENYISKSHCRRLRNAETNNGRVVWCDYMELEITEQDYFIMKQFYEWEKIEIDNFRYAMKGYLPTGYVKGILKLYSLKTTLKGITDKQVEYLQSKERINSTYGMMVTDICRDIIKYSTVDWTSEKPDLEEVIDKENRSLKRFLFYAWGVWVTAYARRNLFTAIVALGEDYVYSDTDSVKYLGDHEEYFNEYNKTVIQKLEEAMKAHMLSMNLVSPKNRKGKSITLGLWDDEGTYSRFKTLGAKRYMVEKENAWLFNKEDWVGDAPKYSKEVIIDGVEFYAFDINLTVAGLNKGHCIPYLIQKYGDNIFEYFDDELYIPPEHTGKLTHTYIDDEMEGYITDYLGNTAYFKELSSIHLEPCDYTMDMDMNYIMYLLGLYEEVEISGDL